MESQLIQLLENKQFNTISTKGTTINLFAIRQMAYFIGETIDITIEGNRIVVWRTPKGDNGKRHVISELNLDCCTKISYDVHTLFID